MADALLTINEVFAPEVLAPMVNKFYTEKSALYRAGISVDVTDRVKFASGGKEITRPIFKTGLEAKDLDTSAATENETQIPEFDHETIPIASKIIPTKFTGSALEDALQDPGAYDSIVAAVNQGFRKAVDKVLMSNKDKNNVDYGAEGVGNDYILDVTAEATKVLTWDYIADAKAKFLDTQDDPIAMIMHSEVARKLLKDKDIKGANLGQALQSGFATLQLLSMPIVFSNNVPVVAAVGQVPAKYTTYLVKLGGLGYAWKRQFGIQVIPKGNDVTQVDFTIRVAGMRNPIGGIEPIVKVITN